MIIGAGLITLSACSTLQFSYGQGVQLAYWWLDGYVDFSSDEAPRAKAALQQWFAWHRKNELQDYARWLNDVQGQAARPVTPEQVCGLSQDIRQRIDTALAAALPLAVSLVVAMRPEQVQHVAGKQARNSAEYADEALRGSVEERRERRVERMVKRLRDYYGPLNDAQLQAVAAHIAASPSDADTALRERQARQADVIDVLQRSRGATPAQAQRLLEGLLRRLQHSPRAAYRAYEARVLQHECQGLATVHNLADKAQRDVFRAKLKGWEEDLRALAAAPG